MVILCIVRFRSKTYIALCIVSGTCIYDQNAVELLKKYGYALIPAHDKNKTKINNQRNFQQQHEHFFDQISRGIPYLIFFCFSIK